MHSVRHPTHQGFPHHALTKDPFCPDEHTLSYKLDADNPKTWSCSRSSALGCALCLKPLFILCSWCLLFWVDDARSSEFCPYVRLHACMRNRGSGLYVLDLLPTLYLWMSTGAGPDQFVEYPSFLPKHYVYIILYAMYMYKKTKMTGRSDTNPPKINACLKRDSNANGRVPASPLPTKLIGRPERRSTFHAKGPASAL